MAQLRTVNPQRDLIVGHHLFTLAEHAPTDVL